MACPCNTTPCSCNPHFPPGYLDPCPPKPCTRCTGDWTNNSWIERESPEAMGVCLLDNLCEEQIIAILERNDQARADLLRITSDPRLLELARTVQRLPAQQQDDATMTALNRPNTPASLPFYAVFRGQPPFAQ